MEKKIVEPKIDCGSFLEQIYVFYEQTGFCPVISLHHRMSDCSQSGLIG